MEQGASKATACQLLDHHGTVAKIGLRPAQFCGQAHAQQAQLTGFAPKLTRDLALTLPTGVVWGNFFVDEAAHQVAQCGQLLAVAIVPIP